jgi:hypothetical protein
MSLRALITVLAALAAGHAAAENVYRCGNVYTSVPCVNGRLIETHGATTAAQRAEAARVAAHERRLAEDMARDRRRSEAELHPAAATSLGPAKPPAAAASTPARTKKKTRRKTRAIESDDFIARVPKAKSATN